MPAEPRMAPDAAGHLTARIPVATYRLQLNPELGFAAARDLLPYLDALGISDVYTSPYLAARTGSLHGYDVVDHGVLNPELGTEAEHAAFCRELRGRGMGHILDVVPNHMGVADGANRWWNDVLENGPSSPYATYFDIDWDPVERHLRNTVLLPVLGDQYGRVLERQELTLTLDDGAFRLHYYGTVLPIEPCSTGQILDEGLAALVGLLGEDDPARQEYESIRTALSNLPGPTDTAPERVRQRMREKEVIRRRLAQLVETSAPARQALDDTLRALNGVKGNERSFDGLDRLLGEQPYRLAHWRVAAHEINYRRFFDINELAAIRMEVPEVFREAHRLIFRLVHEGAVTGLRIDHPDGLFDPPEYFLALQRERAAQCERARLLQTEALDGPDLETAVEQAADRFASGCAPDPKQPGCRPLYVVAEKVLGRGERLPAGWAIHGTTGYEFLAQVSQLFVDPDGARPLTATYTAFTGLRTTYPEVVYQAKHLIVEAAMASELEMLGHALGRLARRSRVSRDFTRASLTHALREIIACFPLYRTYIDGRQAEVALQDRACVEVAVAFARRRNPTTNASIFEFVRDTLLVRPPEDADDLYQGDQLAFARKLQQVTAPVMAKGAEDTAFYRYNRLVSLNEVGGDPDQFGMSPDDFHRQCEARLRDWPAGLCATSTHDTKRGEDVRARIHVLSEMPQAWRAAVRRWHRVNRRHLVTVEGRPAPDRNDEYLLYQTLVGAWPPGELAGERRLAFTERIQAYMVKAAKEAKVHTSWINPSEAYDGALRGFVAGILAPVPGNRFPADLAVFHEPVARLGMVNGLAQTLLKITAPGVPDFYQGTELWDLSLVDPDNRRAVDWSARRAALDGLTARLRAGDPATVARDLVRTWPDGRIKLLVTLAALACRRAAWELFAEGEYLPLEGRGAHGDRLCAFARRHSGRAVVVVVPRLTAALTKQGSRLPLGAATWKDTAAVGPPELAGRYVDVFTGAEVPIAAGAAGAVFPLATLLGEFPVAMLAQKGSGSSAGHPAAQSC